MTDNNRTADFSNIEYVFLDRDGVLNRNPPDGLFVTCWKEFHLLPGVEVAIEALNRSGRKVIVVTNQRAVALKLISRDDLDRVHGRLKEQLALKGAALDAIYVCPHDVGECTCRKPQTGLLEQAFADFPGAKPGNSVMIGDSLRDIEAGRPARSADCAHRRLIGRGNARSSPRLPTGASLRTVSAGFCATPSL